MPLCSTITSWIGEFVALFFWAKPTIMGQFTKTETFKPERNKKNDIRETNSWNLLYSKIDWSSLIKYNMSVKTFLINFFWQHLGIYSIIEYISTSFLASQCSHYRNSNFLIKRLFNHLYRKSLCNNSQFSQIIWKNRSHISQLSIANTKLCNQVPSLSLSRWRILTLFKI